VVHQAIVQLRPLGVLPLPLGEPLQPRRPGLRAALHHLAGVCQHLGLDHEGLIGVEAEHFLGGPNLVVAERGAVRRAGVLLVRRRPADDRPEDDDGRATRLGAGGDQGVVQGRDVLSTRCTCQP
jgi:hypothetical protein